MLHLYVIAATFITVTSATSGTLQECRAAALNFRSTCPGAPDTPGNWSQQATMKPVTVKCDCAGGNLCEMYHMLCVTCFTEKGGGQQVFMRVQTSGLPKRCIGGQESDFRLIDFSVAFNPSTDPRKKIFANQQDFDQIACNPNKVLEPPASSMLSINSISGSYQ